MQRIALLSAGLDSAAALALSLEQKHEISTALTFDYGQRAARQEIKHSEKIAKHYRIPHAVIPLDFMRGFSNALQTRSQPLPHYSTGDLIDPTKTQASAKSVWVPNRNGVFLSIAAAIAESKNIRQVLVGFNREEAETFADNSVAFAESVTKSFFYSTRNHVEVISPTMELTKTQIVKELVRLDFPMRYLWSCYESFDQMCGECESCARLKRALDANGMNDAVQFRN